MKSLLKTFRLAPVLFLVVSLAQAAKTEVGALLRSGEWAQGVGSHGIPAQFVKLKPAHWPKDQWYSLRLEGTEINIKKQVLVGSQSNWLTQITEQIPIDNAESTPQLSEQPEYDATLYLRVLGAKIIEGPHPLYIFKNGTPALQPELDYQYQLKLAEVPFKMRVQNGLKGKNGTPYGEGATYFIEYDGKKFEYALGYFGWASRIVGISDIDGDGYPDFIIDIDGSNSGVTYILLSSTAKPGKNAATASLHSWGC